MAGELSPIEDVIRDAEDRAQREWDREYQPCPHEVVILTFVDVDGMCASCQLRVPYDG